MTLRDQTGSDSLFKEWSLLDDRIVWQGPVEDWAGLPANRLGSGAAFAGLLGPGGADRMMAIRDAAASSNGLFETRYELRVGRISFVLEERGKCICAPDGRPAIVRSRLRKSMQPFIAVPRPAPVDGIAPRSVLFDRLHRLLADGETIGLLHVEPIRREDGVARLLLDIARRALRHGDQAAPFDESSILLALRGADHEQMMLTARQLQEGWSAAGTGGLVLSAVAAPKYGRTPALLVHRLLNTRDIARTSGAVGLLCHSEQLASRDSGLRRVALGDELVAALNARAVRLASRFVRHGGADELYGVDLVAVARLDLRQAELAPLRPLYARLDVAEAIDHRIAELGLARALVEPAPVCIFLSSATAASGWLDLVEAVAAREGGVRGRLIVDLPVHEAASSPDETRAIAARLRMAGCGLSLSGIRDLRDVAEFDADLCRLSPLALGDVAYSAEARRRVRQISAGLQDRGALVVAPPAPGREAALFLRACGVALVDDAASDQGGGAQPAEATRAA